VTFPVEKKTEVLLSEESYRVMLSRIRTFLEMIRFEHTIFALPFAYLGMMLAAHGWPAWDQFLWITVAMASARTLAMTVNRIADRDFDARNPRTTNRAIPAGKLSVRAARIAAIIAGLLLVVAAWQLNPLCLALLPFAALLLVGYHYTKRFTFLSHWILGLTDGAAAMGAWIAVRPTLANPIPWLLWLAVTVWIAGFDLIYACQDTDFDRREGLQSVPARFGNAVALLWARINHTLTVILLLAVGLLAGLSWPFWLGLAIIAGLLAYEHSLVHPDDLSRVDLAFFNVNGYVSVIAFVSVFVALLV
jgi:4-hydroxybenzoate polyprenyltransferase